MQTFKKAVLTALGCCALTAALSGTDSVFVAEAMAQDRSDRDNDRGDSREWRRRSWRQDRDRDRDEDDRSERETDKDASGDTPSLSTETWAKGFLKQHDKNKNGWLDGDELQAAGRRAQAADFNNDKAVTAEELVASTVKGTASIAAAAHTTETSEKSSDESKDEDRDEARESRGGFFGFGPRDRDDDGDRSDEELSKSSTSRRVFTWLGGGKAGADGKNVRRTYRFTPAGERLPTGLPSWFKSQDRNRNGQVEMSEYSRSWSKSTVARFQRYDVDGDGIITAKEAAEKE
jgi:hypothetical protein